MSRKNFKGFEEKIKDAKIEGGGKKETKNPLRNELAKKREKRKRIKIDENKSGAITSVCLGGT